MKATTIALLAAASTAMATAPTPARRHAVLPRETDSDFTLEDIPDECIDNAVSFLDSIPTPDPELSQALDSPTEEGCYSLPADLRDMFRDWESSYSSWISDNSALVSSLTSNCAKATGLPAAPGDFCEGAGTEDRDDDSAGSVADWSLGAVVGSFLGLAILL